MFKILISEETKTAEEMAETLERIAALIRDGMTSGFYPTWTLDGTEEAARRLNSE